MSRPLVSVVVPCFQDASGLSWTLDAFAALPEDLRHRVEVIVQDGGSNDGSLDVVAGHMGTVAHVTSGPDAGIYDAMNRGVTKARGRWVWVLGAGDVPDAEGLRAVVAAVEHRLEEQPAAVDVAWACAVEALPPVEPGVPDKFTPEWDARLTWRNTVHHQGLWAPREWLVAQPFDTTCKVLGDYAWLLDRHRFGQPVECLPGVCLARVEAQGASRQFTPALYLEEWRVKSSRLPWGARLAHVVWLPAKWAFKQVSKAAKMWGSSTAQ